MAISVLRGTHRLRFSPPWLARSSEASAFYNPQGRECYGIQSRFPELGPTVTAFKAGHLQSEPLDLRSKSGVAQCGFGLNRGRFSSTCVGRSLHITCPGVRRASTSAAAEAGTSQGPDPADGSLEDVEGVTVKHRFVSNGGQRLHYVEAGDPGGQLAVLLHGWPSFWYCWVYQLKPLVEAGYHVVIPDMRGYNLSDKPSNLADSGRYNLSDQPRNLADFGREPCLSDIKLLIEKSSGGRPANLIAHDWGGAIAWHFVRSYPHLVSRLVTLNIPETSTFNDALEHNKEQRKKSWYIAFFQIPFLPEWLLSRNNYKGLQIALKGSKPRTEELLRRHVDAFSRPGALTASINYYRAGGRGHWAPAGDPPGRVELPVKVIWGEDDVALGKELAAPPKELVPNHEVVFLPGVSHWCMWDDPERVSAEILDFLAKDVS
ncbi:hypothetical protein KFL_005940010 [Klebsormidium nitens]|uniref:AB hydrolase-1 domain-containing protein n=1 Tax=Klebsormidium nitens TaxID=105231 RepID=A0A1Y1IMS3_KLENI|nr:hypothetical protein KFL_005940010 [Klebsormidium nitens]|eukprot:GAQ90056.1 hypothetical protein KFL_005940010 [Klebsormidium nitens]